MTTVAVIIPTRNEAAELPETLARIQAIRPQPCIVVVDGGSSDGTLEVARALGVGVIQSPVAGRGFQINLGIQSACADVAWVVHADTWISTAHYESLVAAMEGDRSLLGGGFHRTFRSPSWVLRWTCRLASLRNRTMGWHLGDQAMFVRKSVWAGMGGFPEWSRFEDLEFSRRLGRLGAIASLHPPVSTSARRFERDGSLGVTLRDFLLTIKYLAGWEARCGLK